MKKLLSFISIGFISLTLAFSVQAENSTKHKYYTVHHNAFKSDFITPEIATQYNINRSKYRGLINISIIKNVKNTTGTPVAAKVTIKAHTLAGLVKDIELKEIREQNAIYYIGEFPVTNQEIVNFTIKATPEGDKNVLTNKMTHKFYID